MGKRSVVMHGNVKACTTTTSSPAVYGLPPVMLEKYRKDRSVRSQSARTECSTVPSIAGVRRVPRCDTFQGVHEMERKDGIVEPLAAVVTFEFCDGRGPSIVWDYTPGRHGITRDYTSGTVCFGRQL